MISPRSQALQQILEAVVVAVDETQFAHAARVGGLFGLDQEIVLLAEPHRHRDVPCADRFEQFAEAEVLFVGQMR